MKSYMIGNSAPKSLVRMVFLAAMGVGTVWSARVTAGVIYDTTNDAILIDNSGYSVGGNVQYGSLTIGEGTSDINETRAWVPFALTEEQRTDIASAGSVRLSLRLSANNDTTGYTLDIIGLSGRTSDVAVADDYEAAGTVVVDDTLDGTSEAQKRYEFDVTQFVKEQAAIPDSVVVFRLQMDPDTLPNSDGQINNFTFNSYDASQNKAKFAPQLITGPAVPEPASLALLGLSVGGLMLRRR